MRWIMLLVLFLVRLAMGYQFQSVASTSTQLVDAFGLSYAEVGTLIGFFLLPGVFIAIPSGALTRTVADKNLLMLGAMAMAVGAFLMGSATNPSELYAGRVITGVGGTIFNVILTKMVTDWFIEKEIVLALSVMLTAWPIGIALGLLIHGPVADAYGWSWAMDIAAIAALAALFLTAAFYRAPPSSATKTSTTLRYGLPSRELVHISIVGLGWTLYNAALVAVVSFAPDALVSAGSERDAAHSVTSLFMWTMLISLPLGGRLLESIGYITTAITLSLLTAAALIIALSFAVAPVAMFVLLGVLAGIPAGALISLSAEAVRPENRGPGLGIFYTWYYAGMTVAPVIAGWLRDWSGSTKAPVLFSAGAHGKSGAVCLATAHAAIQLAHPRSGVRGEGCGLSARSASTGSSHCPSQRPRAWRTSPRRSSAEGRAPIAAASLRPSSPASPAAAPRRSPARYALRAWA